MSTQSTTEVTVRREVLVPLPPDRAFALFSTRMGEFWPKTHSIGSAPQADVMIEPRDGGRWYERGTDGSECEWGRVARWAPPGELVLLWQINAGWAYQADFETEVEVSFTGQAEGTLVAMRHRHLERYGDRVAAMRESFESPGGWGAILDAFAALSRE